MALTLQAIIQEADVRVPNSFDDPQKVDWLNEINQEFFEVVKIPKTASFTTTAGTTNYILPIDVRSRNIEKVHVGTTIYLSFLYESVPPGQSFYTFDESTSTLTLSPAPTRSGLTGIVRYNRVATTQFVSSNLNATPDAPPEFHYIYIFGLAMKIAEALDDVVKANNYNSRYVNALNVAAQNFRKAG